ADVNAPEFLAELSRLAPDILISVSCPQIFKKPLIELPPLGILNIHGAILPQYRGVLPSFWMLANGEKKAGVSIYYVDTRIDAGELCGQRIYDIPPDETLDGFLRRSKTIAADEVHWTITGQNSVTVDWRGGDAEVRYGTTQALERRVEAVAPEPLPFSSRGPFREAKITGLEQNTLYYYSIGGGPLHTFRTPPPRGGSGFTFYVQGDIG